LRFPQDFIEKVREANDIGEVIGQYTELKSSGHRLTGRCPFPDHSDKSPSFSVTEDQQLYYCYGCKKGGNLFTFLETFNGMNFPEAVEFLARRANIPLPEPEAGTKRPGALSSDEKDVLLKVNRTTAVFFHHNLKSQTEDSPVQKYLIKRGLTNEIVETFRLGFATEEWQGLGRHLVGKGVKIESIEKLQLIKAKKNPPTTTNPIEKYFDLFRDRLMFPIFGPNGDTLGFGGRVLDDTLPKYVNSADSPVFHKSKVLYGLHETGKYIRAQDEVIVVEGYMDAIALYASGFKNVVAILGTAMTPEHAKLLKRYTTNVKMLLDGDEAGINAAEKSLPVLLAGGMMPKGLILPEKMDPDEFIKVKGAEALRNELDRAPELFNILLTKRWLSNYHGSDSEKVQVISEAAVALGPMANKSLMELYLLELSRQLDVDGGWVRRAVAQAVQALAPRVAPGQQANTARPTSPPQGNGPSRPQAFALSPTQSAAQIPNSGANDAPDLGFAPPDERFALGESAESGELDQELTAERAKPVSLKGAPRDESFVMSLLLYNESLMRELVEAGPDELLNMLTHEGIKDVLKRATDRYQAKPGGFATIAPSLASEVDQPALLASSLPLTATLTADGAEKKLMADYLGAIRRRFQKVQGKNLVSQLRERSTPEMLEQVQQLQRNRLAKGSPKEEPS
jgi:DNA primase